MSSLNDDDKKYYMSMELKDLERILPYSGKASEYINTLIELKKMELYSKLPRAPTERIFKNIPREKMEVAKSIYNTIYKYQLIKQGGDPVKAKQETLPLFEYEIRQMVSMRGRKTRKMRKSKSKSKSGKRSRGKKTIGKTKKSKKSKKSRKTAKRSRSKNVKNKA